MRNARPLDQLEDRAFLRLRALRRRSVVASWIDGMRSAEQRSGRADGETY
jgi:hypothetical protein